RSARDLSGRLQPVRPRRRGARAATVPRPRPRVSRLPTARRRPAHREVHCAPCAPAPSIRRGRPSPPDLLVQGPGVRAAALRHRTTAADRAARRALAHRARPRLAARPAGREHRPGRREERGSGGRDLRPRPRPLTPDTCRAIDAIVADVFRPATGTPQLGDAARTWGERERFIAARLDGTTRYPAIAGGWP